MKALTNDVALPAVVVGGAVPVLLVTAVLVGVGLVVVTVSQ